MRAKPNFEKRLNTLAEDVSSGGAIVQAVRSTEKTGLWDQRA